MTQSTSENHHDIIPDTLLAQAKDSRYVQDCQSLCLQVLSTFFPRRRYPRLEQESWILACLLCLAFGMRQTTKATTIGMETVGLQFSSTNNHKRWKFVLATVSTLAWAYAFSPTTNNSGSSNDATTNSSFASSDATNRITSNSNNNNEDEMLRGNRRRQFHEAQRQAMLRRANHLAAAESSSAMDDTVEAHSQQPTIPNATNTANTSINSIGKNLLRKLQMIAYQLAQILSCALLAPLEGPHTLIHQQQHQQQQQQSTSNIQSIGRWVAKLQLAHFCLTGKYPTWVHRLSGHSFMASSSSSDNRLSHRPKTARLVGLLIGAQAMGALMQATSSYLSQWLLRRRLLQQQQQQQQRATTDAPLTTSPPVVFVSEASSLPSSSNNNKQETSSICAICRTPRTHPAAPSSCGHVACWNCLVQWVSTIRPACPLCRAVCRPQDIVALYHYEPNSSNSSSSI